MAENKFRYESDYASQRQLFGGSNLQIVITVHAGVDPFIVSDGGINETNENDGDISEGGLNDDLDQETIVWDANP